MDLLAALGVHLFETLFFIGLLGSLSVVLVSLVQDLRDSLPSDEKDEPA